MQNSDSGNDVARGNECLTDSRGSKAGSRGLGSMEMGRPRGGGAASRYCLVTNLLWQTAGENACDSKSTGNGEDL